MWGVCSCHSNTVYQKRALNDFGLFISFTDGFPFKAYGTISVFTLDVTPPPPYKYKLRSLDKKAGNSNSNSYYAGGGEGE